MAAPVTPETVMELPARSICGKPYVTVAVLPVPPLLIEVTVKKPFVVLSQTARYPMLPELSSMISTFGVTTLAMKGGVPE